MAVLEDVPGIEVTVQVAGIDAAEYEDPNASEQDVAGANCPTSTKYIECIDGAEFAIKTRVTGDYRWSHPVTALNWDFRMDDKSTRGYVIRRGDMVNGVATKTKADDTVYCSHTKQWIRQRFQFSAVDVVDDAKKDRIEDDTKIAKHLGMIQVRIYRCIYLGHRASSFRKPTTSNKLELAEKSLKGKAISHGTSFLSSGKGVPAPTSCNISYLDGRDKPIATFRFHYRSRDALKREMVIPRSPSPSPGPKREVARMSRAELERLAGERLVQLQRDGNIKEERKPSLKREFKEVVDLSGETERPGKSSRTALEIPEEVIDLTDD
ncbi:hypothetical protein F4813DRAFT_210382 [Daldinia decipiens]|uniref:uncharacterized protein n=1 Tax=Daldinia decipiens TaxID=326647 RepID=UPI0020C39C96|nr:uncharacterized protein F4813DRAFT_210382 [Daldinia decipiens]KAI1654261.1 hypothetical protein F4813DRAFT_210382 [Daldinia decipiens]